MEWDAVDEVARQWARERPTMPTDSIGVVGRILRIAKLLMDERRRVLSALDIDHATFDLLATLLRTGHPYRMSPTALAEASLISGGAITQRVTRAEESGLVRTVRTDSGKRTVAVELTPHGHQVIERDVEALLRREHELISHLSETDRDQLADHLRRLLAGLPKPR